MMQRKRLTPIQSRESARRAKRAFREAYLGFHNSSEGVGDGGEQVGDVGHDYGVSPADVRAERDKKPWADGSESEEAYLDEGEGFKMGEAKLGEAYLDEALKRCGFKMAFRNKSGGRTFENEAGRRIFVSKQGEAYSKGKDGAKTYYANESEIMAAHAKRESVRTFFRRLNREV